MNSASTPEREDNVFVDITNIPYDIQRSHVWAAVNAIGLKPMSCLVLRAQNPHERSYARVRFSNTQHAVMLVQQGLVIMNEFRCTASFTPPITSSSPGGFASAASINFSLPSRPSSESSIPITRSSTPVNRVTRSQTRYNTTATPPPASAPVANSFSFVDRQSAATATDGLAAPSNEPPAVNPCDVLSGSAVPEGVKDYTHCINGVYPNGMPRYVAEADQYIRSFISYIARLPHDARPKSGDEIKEKFRYFRTYISKSIGITPGSAVHHMNQLKVFKHTSRHKLVFTNLEQYGPQAGDETGASSPSRNGTLHRPGQRIRRTDLVILNSSRAELEADKNGVKIGQPQEALSVLSENDPRFIGLEDDALTIKQSDEVIKITFTIRVDRGRPDVTLTKHPYFLNPMGDDLTITVKSRDDQSDPLVVSSRRMTFLELTLKPRNVGYLLGVICFEFGTFVICRYVNVHVQDGAYITPADEPRASESVTTTPITAAISSNRRKLRAVRPVADSNNPPLRGRPPPRPNFQAFENPLLQYHVPKEMRRRFDLGEYKELDNMTFSLSYDKYSATFATLCWLEELQMEVDIRKYDMHGVELIEAGPLYQLKVPGLAEKRPSVMYGDKVTVMASDDPTETRYEGYTHRVEQEQVLLSFHDRFRQRVFVRGRKFNIMFQFNRTPIKRQHQALDLTKTLPREVLFPSIAPPRATSAKPADLSGLRGLNEEQTAAVRNVVENSCSYLPYVIFGPPGTGKTRTLTECIMQTYQNRKSDSVHILAFAPRYYCFETVNVKVLTHYAALSSNSAADQICERISGMFSRSMMFRLNAYRRERAELSAKVMEYSRYSESTGIFDTPTKQEMMAYTVVVVTAVSGGLLYSMGLPRGHFTHFFIDEAGHCIEPEFWIGIAGLMDTTPGRSQIVLAGDPMQLGPVLRSDIVKQFGLHRSYLERLTELPVYKPKQSQDGSHAQYENPHLVTKLVRNYRSHPALLTLPNQLFYNSDLIPAADVAMRESLSTLPFLPNRNQFPLVFVGVNGKDMQEAASPSWYNPDEVSMVNQWVDKLRSAPRSYGISSDQIGVITPYRRQVQRLRNRLQPSHGDAIKVASVEEFQGQERRIIIISTVRSSAKYFEHDSVHNLGFLRNPKRFNVAITRAKALLVVIGNPVVLSSDKHWKALIDYCRDNKAIVGYDPQLADPTDAMSGLLTALDRMRMAQDEDDDDNAQQQGANGASLVTNVEEPEWNPNE
ncbi:hypothetical protein SmJEL517_g04200 [Synchytrium microbalum]|uniref:RNA helicase n=1 Tax=Synchytrium microbalum TaxID=1806994 RepID=A0A507C402_9FUNG|nr:uncharacterized protein SmJEL517_g04200 [Synchytrium microbalum]TPX32696.1 hypothetical protein SmJEL517_g04200 [Synchytrium microbalum]